MSGLLLITEMPSIFKILFLLEDYFIKHANQLNRLVNKYNAQKILTSLNTSKSVEALLKAVVIKSFSLCFILIIFGEFCTCRCKKLLCYN